jgi:hypothetical protein
VMCERAGSTSSRTRLFGITHPGRPGLFDAPRLPGLLGVILETVQHQADEAFSRLERDARHPSLHFKKVGRFWSARVGAHHRTLAVEVPDGLVWFCGSGSALMLTTTGSWADPLERLTGREPWGRPGIRRRRRPGRHTSGGLLGALRARPGWAWLKTMRRLAALLTPLWIAPATGAGGEPAVLVLRPRPRPAGEPPGHVRMYREGTDGGDGPTGALHSPTVGPGSGDVRDSPHG